MSSNKRKICVQRKSSACVNFNWIKFFSLFVFPKKSFKSFSKCDTKIIFYFYDSITFLSCFWSFMSLDVCYCFVCKSSIHSVVSMLSDVADYTVQMRKKRFCIISPTPYRLTGNIYTSMYDGAIIFIIQFRKCELKTATLENIFECQLNFTNQPLACFKNDFNVLVWVNFIETSM